MMLNGIDGTEWTGRAFRKPARASSVEQKSGLTAAEVKAPGPAGEDATNLSDNKAMSFEQQLSQRLSQRLRVAQLEHKEVLKLAQQRAEAKRREKEAEEAREAAAEEDAIAALWGTVDVSLEGEGEVKEEKEGKKTGEKPISAPDNLAPPPPPGTSCRGCPVVFRFWT